MEIEILKILRYFHQFTYSPTEDEIFRFVKVKTSREQLTATIHKLLKDRQICSEKVKNSVRYTIEGYSMYFGNYPTTTAYSKKKTKLVKSYLSILSRFPQIKLVGISGSVAMMNAKEHDDIDLFIITAKNKLWTGRCIALLLAEVKGLRRKRGLSKARDKICLNLFFDEANLKVPKFKRTEYVAHEILQMKPIINKENIYHEFLKQNYWVFDLFPNAIDIVGDGKKEGKIVMSSGFWVMRFLGNILEKVLKIVQRYYIQKHQTTELVTQTQLWFHPDDFEKRVINL